MKLIFLDPFRRGCERLDVEQQAAVLRVLLEIDAAFARPHEQRGLGVRKLHPLGIWEIRVGLGLRVVLRLRGDEVMCCLLGSHDEVQRSRKSL